MSAYVKPGVYSKYVRTPGSVKVSAGARIVSVIGEGPTYFTEEDEAIVRNEYPYGSNPDALAYTASTLISIGDYPGSSDYVQDTDYQIVGGEVDWIIGGDAPVAGATYYVTYRHDKTAADYNPQLFVKISDIENEYGKESITNTLTMGAKISSENGANYLICTQVTASSEVAYTTAIDKLKLLTEGVSSTVIVPLNTDDAIHAYLKTHVQFMSSQFQKKERYGVIGMAIGATQAAVKAKGVALAYNRIILPWDEVKRQVTDPDTNVTSDVSLDGSFLACAIAGMMCKYPVQEPLTRKTMVSFNATTKTDSLLETEKNELAAKGVTLLKNKGGIISIRHGMTTNVTTAEDNEISVMLIRDNTIQIVRDAIDSLYIATVSSEATESAIKTDISAILSLLIEGGSITDFEDVVVSQNAADATRYDVTFGITPAYPINTIYITFTI